MITTQLVILLLAIAALAFYAGFLFGRQAASAPQDRDMPGTQAERDLQPAPSREPLPGPRTMEPPRPRGAPPPAAAGGTALPSAPHVSAGAAPGGSRPEPRRTTAPPPARAGLLDPGKNGSKK